jgi:alditol oxidase
VKALLFSSLRIHLYTSTMPLTNWAANYTYTASRLHTPRTIEEVQNIVANAHRVKAVGTRHAFNHIADTPEDQISLQHLNRIIRLDSERSTVTIEGGVRYGELCQYLYEHGYALHNLASLPHISVAGAVATATHGSGDRNGNLASIVTAIEFVDANGDIITLSRERDADSFKGAVVSLGSLGVITKLTLTVIPTFTMRQDVYENLALAQLEHRFDEITSSAYSVSLFTNWKTDFINQVWLKSVVSVDDPLNLPSSFFGATRAAAPLHPIAGISSINCTEQMGSPGPWHERLPHFRMNFTPSSGEELQSEYFIPRPDAIAALHAINQMRESIAPLLQISEIRTITADNFLMSPCYQQDCIAIHFTWKKDWSSVRALLPLIEETLIPFNARPHWGKLFTISPDQIKTIYPQLPSFKQFLLKHDPQGKFRNPFLDTYIFYLP